jgi:hypothetical protein
MAGLIPAIHVFLSKAFGLPKETKMWMRATSAAYLKFLRHKR